MSKLSKLLEDENFLGECAAGVVDALFEADARIAELEATIRKFQLVEKALNYLLEKDTPHTWRYRREEAEELARAALGEKDD